MSKLINFLKGLRFEYKVVLIFSLLFLISIPYSIIRKDIELKHNFSGYSSGAGNYNSSGKPETLSDLSEKKDKPSSISEAVEAERPIIMNDSIQENNNSDNNISQQMMSEYPDIKKLEVATNVKNPTVWVYSLNNGLRKDDLAEEYCKKLHSKGLMALNVVIYDEKERLHGRLVELGEARCM